MCLAGGFLHIAYVCVYDRFMKEGTHACGSPWACEIHSNTAREEIMMGVI